MVEVRSIATRRQAVCVQLNRNGQSNESAGPQSNNRMLIADTYCYVFQ
jgi:hypothetical protein